MSRNLTTGTFQGTQLTNLTMEDALTIVSFRLAVARVAVSDLKAQGVAPQQLPPATIIPPTGPRYLDTLIFRTCVGTKYGSMRHSLLP